MAMTDLTEDKKERLKDAYLTDAGLSLKGLADISKSICRVAVSYEVLKMVSWTEGWGVIKRRQQLGKEGQPVDVADEADDLRKLLYGRVMDPEASLNATDMANLIRTWDTVRAVSPRVTSGKSTRQQVIDSTRIGIEAVMQLVKEREENENPPS